MDKREGSGSMEESRKSVVDSAAVVTGILERQALIADLCVMLSKRGTARALIEQATTRLRSLAEFSCVVVLQLLGQNKSGTRSRFFAIRGASGLASAPGTEIVAPSLDSLMNGKDREGLPGSMILDAAALSTLRGAGLPVSAEASEALAIGIAVGDSAAGVLLVTGDSAALGDQQLVGFLRTVGSVIGSAFRMEASFLELQSTQESFRGVVEKLNDVIVVVDEDWRVLYANRRSEDVTGIEVPKLMGAPISSVLAGPGAADVGALLQTALGSRDDFEVELKDQQNKSYWLQLRVDSVEYEGNQKANLVSGLDITQARDLQHRFLHAQKMEAVATLAGGLSHDFNNILTAINGYSELMLPEITDPSLRNCIEEIRAAGRRARSLTDKLLVFSKQIPQEIRAVSLNEVVKGLWPLIGRLVEENVIFHSALGADVPLVAGDTTQIEQVILNLIVNARDAMPEGGQISVTTKRRELVSDQISGIEAGVYGELVISDTGEGIEPAIIDKLFEPFFSTKEATLGTGLGLSTVYGIVQAARGHVDIESEVGEGASFRVLFPEASEMSRVQHPIRIPPQPDTPASGVPGSGETLLVVEDDQVLRRLFVVSLSRLGYRVLSARDGEQAVAILEDPAARVDLVLSDLVMPKIGGRELALWVAERRGEIGIVLMTGYAREEDRLPELLRQYQVLSKPFETHQLQEAVAKALDQRLPKRETRSLSE